MLGAYRGGGVPCSLHPSPERMYTQSLNTGVRSDSLCHEKFMRDKVCLAEMLQIEITVSSLSADSDRDGYSKGPLKEIKHHISSFSILCVLLDMLDVYIKYGQHVK